MPSAPGASVPGRGGATSAAPGPALLPLLLLLPGRAPTEGVYLSSFFNLFPQPVTAVPEGSEFRAIARKERSQERAEDEAEKVGSGMGCRSREQQVPRGARGLNEFPPPRVPSSKSTSGHPVHFLIQPRGNTIMTLIIM